MKGAMLLCIRQLLQAIGVILLLTHEGISETVKDLPGHMQPLGSHMPPLPVEDRITVPDPVEFFETYVKPSIPVIFRGAAKKFPSFDNWQDDNYLKEKYGRWIMNYERSKKEGDFKTTVTSFSKFLNIYNNKSIYMAEYINADNPLTDEVYLLKCMSCGGYREHIETIPIFFSSGDTKSALHRDASDNLHCMMDGSKEWIIFDKKYSPDIPSDGPMPGYCGVDPEKVDMHKYPTLQKLPWHHVKVEKGDCLFLPSGWPHHVISHNGRNLAVNVFWEYMHFLDRTDCPENLDEIPDYKPIGKKWRTQRSHQKSDFLAWFSDGLEKIGLRDFVSKLLDGIDTGPNEDDFLYFAEVDKNNDGMLSAEEFWQHPFDDIPEDPIQEFGTYAESRPKSKKEEL